MLVLNKEKLLLLPVIIYGCCFFYTEPCLFVQIDNRYIDNASFLIQENTRLLQCAKLCMKFSACLSLSLALHSLQCRLNYITKENYPNLLTQDTGKHFLYMAKQDFQEEFKDEGHSSNCEIDTKYFPKLKRCIPYNFGPIVNVALGKKTASSSTLTYAGITFVSQFAVDGNWGSDAYNDGCAHTQHELRPWWRVDLQYPHIVHSITIQNRGDQNGEFLHDIEVFAGHNATSLQLCGTFDGPGYNGQRVELTCRAPIVGSIVKIMLNDTDFLTLCEVGVNAFQLL